VRTIPEETHRVDQLTELYNCNLLIFFFVQNLEAISNLFDINRFFIHLLVAIYLFLFFALIFWQGKRTKLSEEYRMDQNGESIRSDCFRQILIIIFNSCIRQCRSDTLMLNKDKMMNPRHQRHPSDIAERSHSNILQCHLLQERASIIRHNYYFVYHFKSLSIYIIELTLLEREYLRWVMSKI